MSKKSNNILNNNYIGINKRSELTGVFNPKNTYLNSVNASRYIEFDFTTLNYSLPINITRYSDGSYLDTNGWIVRNTNDLRINHSYTGYTLGVLIEEQRTNLRTYSEQANRYLTSGIVGYTANAGDTLSSNLNIIRGLDGTTTAERVVPSTAYITRSPNLGAYSSTRHFVSVFVKAAELTKVWMGDLYGAYIPAVRFGVTAGNIINPPTGGAPGTYWYTIAQRTRDDWFRIGVNSSNNYSAGDGNLAWGVMPYPDGATNFGNYNLTFAGQTGAGMYMWGFSIEDTPPARSYETSYIRTEDAQVTRLPDQVTVSGTGPSNGPWINQPGSFYVEYYRRDGNGVSANTIISTDNVTGRFICLEQPNAGSSACRLNWGAGSISITGGITGFNKAAFTFTGSSGSVVQLALNGNVSGTTTTNLVPANIQWLTLGARSTSINSGFSDYFSSTIAKIRYYPRQLSTAELRQITL